MVSGYVTGQPRAWLRVEGLFTFVVATVLYAAGDASWLLFGLLFLVPDLSFAGYIAGPGVGALIYNLLHSYAGPLLATLVLLLLRQPVTWPLIWLAHIGFDRTLGYGLKHPTAFQHTHLGIIGKRKPGAHTAAPHAQPLA